MPVIVIAACYYSALLIPTHHTLAAEMGKMSGKVTIIAKLQFAHPFLTPTYITRGNVFRLQAGDRLACRA